MQTEEVISRIKRVLDKDTPHKKGNPKKKCESIIKVLDSRQNLKLDTFKRDLRSGILSMKVSPASSKVKQQLNTAGKSLDKALADYKKVLALL
jgi:hypothetical protein